MTGAMMLAVVLTVAPVLTTPAPTALVVKSGDNPSAFVTDCAYVVRAEAESGTDISFYDSQDGEFHPPGGIKAGNGVVVATWTPRTSGSHTLHAVQVGGERTIELEVRPGEFESHCASIIFLRTDHE
ncbi:MULTISPECIES: hypothetical protein [unclassified Nocardia]|uniref:hypothetical protein n=1 Tax=unclassified Nocardia TaxID=2637762 RepID=UPI001CE3B895|nr:MULTISPECIES: hypothetical protein [unclassified Nocardia]